MGSTTETDRERFDRWQNAALDAWEKANRVGIVEAVTGAGKTHVAYKAIKRLTRQYGNGLYPLVVVPTIPLMEQWKAGLEKVFEGDPVGVQGNGHHDTFGTFRNGKPIRAIVSTIHSAVTSLDGGLLDHCRRAGAGHSLLIADECHHLLSQTASLYPRVLDFPFDSKLGLSATVGRYEIRKLGRIVYEYNLRTAVKEGVIPPFDIVNVGVELTADEVHRYLQLEEEAGETLAKVRSIHGLTGIWNESLWVELQRLARYDDDPLVRKLFSLIFKKAELVYTAQHKTALAPDLIRSLVADGRKVLVFFERIRSAETVNDEASPRQMAMATAEELRTGGGVECHVYHSGLSKSDRKTVLERFRKSGPSALLACRALNEGLDVPTVDAAVVVAATQNRRSMIQRIGRTLRQDAGKRRPLIIILHANGTNDEHVRVRPGDEYFAGPARIFETDGASCRKFVRTFGVASMPSMTWVCVMDWEKDYGQGLLPILGELADGPKVKVELTRNRVIEGRVEWVTRAGQFGINGEKLWLVDVRKVMKESPESVEAAG